MQTAYNNDNYTYAGFFVRFAAFLLDMLIVNVLLLFVKIPVWCLKLAFEDTFLFSPVLFSFTIFDIIYYLLTVGYFILATYYCGTTFGKYLMKIRVVSKDGEPLTFMSVLIRETVGRYLSSIILYIGYMLAAWDDEKQGLHDRIADTYVVYKDTCRQKEDTQKTETQMTKAQMPQTQVQQSNAEIQQIQTPQVNDEPQTPTVHQGNSESQTPPVSPTVRYVSSNLGGTNQNGI